MDLLIKEITYKTVENEQEAIEALKFITELFAREESCSVCLNVTPDDLLNGGIYEPTHYLNLSVIAYHKDKIVAATLTRDLSTEFDSSEEDYYVRPILEPICALWDEGFTKLIDTGVI